MQWRPLYDKVLVRRNPAPETIGNVVVPEDAKKPQSVGEVIDVGEGRLNIREGTMTALRIQPGFQVMFSEFSGTQVPELGDEMVLLREDEILAFAEPQAELDMTEFTHAGAEVET
jgi:chaperonin GroES